ncbi:hypothetical protein SB6422_02895 [Klebsiella huaxiensis]|uniref:Uncharacterized protein n=1 Tax=Klebsiella huaxiensis TaxID=2153354 RepID=A0A564MBL1_9ENTR|nr:hypothetical protein SB6422_02895 [Klebsiella huaxiensis]
MFDAGRRLTPCPAYGFTVVCGLVARTGAQHRLREMRRVGCFPAAHVANKRITYCYPDRAPREKPGFSDYCSIRTSRRRTPRRFASPLPGRT